MSATPIEVDFGKAAEDYATHRQGYPPEFLKRLAAFGVGSKDQTVLDIGTGTGLLALALSRAGSRVTGLDPSPELLAKARQAAAAENLSAHFLEGRAEALPFDDHSFDVITAATCWHWFDAGLAAKEAARVLKPDGRLVIAAMDWHSPPDSVPARTMAVLKDFSASVPASRVTTFQYPKATSDLLTAGFRSWDLIGFTTDVAYTRDGWRGRVRASQGVGPTMDAETLARFDSTLAAVLERHYPEEPIAVSHRLFALIARLT